MATDETKIALVQKDIEYIKKSQDRIEQSIKELSNVYITKQEFDDTKLALETEIKQLQHSSNIWKVISPTVASIITAVIVFLAISFLNKV